MPICLPCRTAADTNDPAGHTLCEDEAAGYVSTIDGPGLVAESLRRGELIYRGCVCQHRTVDAQARPSA